MIRKILNVCEKKIIGVLSYINVRKYMKYYTRYLQKIGVKIPNYDTRSFIHPSVYFDGADYSIIEIGQNVTISMDVMLLTHDYSIRNALSYIGKNKEDKRYRFLKQITIGDNSFIGAKSSILPGTTIGSNVIIAAGSVVKGNVPNGTIWGGNPAKQISTIEEFANRHYEMQDYYIQGE